MVCCNVCMLWECFGQAVEAGKQGELEAGGMVSRVDQKTGALGSTSQSIVLDTAVLHHPATRSTAIHAPQLPPHPTSYSLQNRALP